MPAPPSPSRWRRPLAVVALSLLAAEAAYLVAAREVLRSDWLPARLNRRPERLRLTWTEAVSPWPGVVRARQVELRVQTGAVQWWLRAEEAWGTIDLAALPRRVLRFTALRARGVEVRVRRRPRTPEEAAERAALVPEIPGLEFAVRDVDAPPAPPAPRRRPWSLRFDALDLDPVESVWFDEYELRGRLAARGALDLRLRRSTALPRARLEVADATLRVGGRAVVAGLDGELAGAIAEFSHRTTRGWAVSPRVSASGHLAGRLLAAGILNAHLSAAPWLTLDGGAGTVAAQVALGAGRFGPGSALEVVSDDLVAALLDYEARGSGRLRWSVTTDGGAPRARLAAELETYTLRRRDEQGPQLHGTGLTLAGLSRDVTVDGRLADLDLTVELPDAVLPDLRLYNHYLPEAAGVRIDAGSARLRGRFHGRWPPGRAALEATLETEEFAVQVAELGLRGKARVEARLRSEALEERVFDLAGTTADLEEVVLAEALSDPTAPPGPAGPADWWAHLAVDRGTLRPGAAVYLDAEAQARLRDSRPLLALFATRSPLPAWARRVFTVEGIGASGRLRLGRELLELDPFAAVGERVSVQARLRMAGGSRRGVLLAGWGPLALGIELDGAERTTHLVGARQWFVEYPPLSP